MVHICHVTIPKYTAQSTSGFSPTNKRTIYESESAHISISPLQSPTQLSVPAVQNYKNQRYEERLSLPFENFAQGTQLDFVQKVAWLDFVIASYVIDERGLPSYTKTILYNCNQITYSSAHPIPHLYYVK